MNKKRGITLIVLIITIIIMIMLASVVVINTKESIDNAKVITFAEEIRNLEDSVKSYFILNGELPKVDGLSGKNFSNLQALKNNNVEIYEFRNEVKFNQDLNAEFYKLDLAKINVEKISRGTDKKGDQDYFCISYPNLHVYYIKGIHVGDVNYYTLTSKITDMNIFGDENGLDGNNGDGDTSIIQNSSIYVEYNEGYTNNLDVKVSTNMKEGESLYLSVATEPENDSNKKKIQTSIGNNNFHFDRLSDLLNGTNTNMYFDNEGSSLTADEVKLIEGTLVNGEYTSAGRAPENERYIYFSKYDKDGNYITKSKLLNLSKYSNIFPKITSNSVSHTGNNYMHSFEISKGDAPLLVDAKYVYLKEVDGNGNVSNYFKGRDDIDIKYILNNGNEKEINNGKCTVVVPENIISIKFAVVDAAGYYASIESKVGEKYEITYDANGGNNPPAKQIKYKGKSITITDQIPEKEGGYIFEKWNTKADGSGNTYFSNSNYVNDESITLYAIWKDNSKKEAEIATVLPPVLHGLIPVKKAGTQLIDATSEDIAKGTWYKYVDQTYYNDSDSEWANARTANNDLFVWIPRFAYKITDNMNNVLINHAGTIDIVFIDKDDKPFDSNKSLNGYTVHPAFNIPGEKLSGFWVGKYESSKEESSGGIIGIKNDRKSWTNINIKDAFETCYNMQDNEIYRFDEMPIGTTHLMKNTEWGAVVYLAHSKYGRYRTKIGFNNNEEYITGNGGSTTNNINGVYDMSGCTWEHVAAVLDKMQKPGVNGTFESALNSSKYFDVYKIEEKNDFNIIIRGMSRIPGDAIYETRNWFNQFGIGINSEVPWLIRGGGVGQFPNGFGNYVQGQFQGQFSYSPQTGNAAKNVGFRVCIFG